MATVKSKQLAAERRYPIDDHGKLRFMPFYYKNETGGTLADGTEIDLNDLPPGRVRILPALSRYSMTAQGASRVLDIGLRAYADKGIPEDDAGEVEDDDALVADKDVSGAVNDAVLDGGAANMWYDLYSRAGIRAFATVNGGTIPANAVLWGYIAYLYE